MPEEIMSTNADDAVLEAPLDAPDHPPRRRNFRKFLAGPAPNYAKKVLSRADLDAEDHHWQGNAPEHFILLDDDLVMWIAEKRPRGLAAGGWTCAHTGMRDSYFLVLGAKPPFGPWGFYVDRLGRDGPWVISVAAFQ